MTTTRTDHSVSVTGPKGEIAHRDLVAHSKQFERKLHQVTDRIYCMVGEGLANSTLIVGPEGAIVVDTGEDMEEAEAHLAEFRSVTDAPIVAVIFSHFHYINGSQVYVDAAGDDGIELWGHERVPINVANMEAETGAAWKRRAAIQFGAFLPKEGPDAMPNYGIGPYMFHPERFRGRPGYVPPTKLVRGPETHTIAGVKIELTPRRSDSDDTLILYLPDDEVCINNHVWPALFNVYPLRGEPYRDPLLIVDAIDHIREYGAEHLVGVHGPPVSGKSDVATALEEYRDSVQLIWDQSVRAMNKNVGPHDIGDFVRMPKRLREGRLTKPLYGLPEHHARQVHNGLLGWFGNDCATLLPVPPKVEAERIVAGFGGREKVVAAVEAALEENEDRWAAQLCSYLLRVDPDDADGHKHKAHALRNIARTTSSANVRAFCIAEALVLDGALNLSWATRSTPMLDAAQKAPPETFVRALKVQVDPEKAADVDQIVMVDFTDVGVSCGLHIYRGLARFLRRGPERVDFRIELEHGVWAEMVSNVISLRQAIDAGRAKLQGDIDAIEALFDVFDDCKLKGQG